MDVASSELEADLTERTLEILAADLIEDFKLYPRNSVDDYHVSALAESIRAGAKLPPLVADRASKRLTDGFQRRRAFLKVNGPEARVRVILREYADESEMFLDAAQMNAGHGRRLSAFDQVHCISRAEDLGISFERMAVALSLTKDRMEILGQRRTADGSPLKVTMAHLSGQRISPDQKDFNDHRAGGKQQLFYLRQVIGLIESDSLDLSNDHVRAAVERLQGLLNGILVAA